LANLICDITYSTRAHTHARIRMHARIHWMSHFTLPSKYLEKDEFREKITKNKIFIVLRSNLMRFGLSRFSVWKAC